jgi:predicted regulator of Ras-like GTPase activity (Roadblock/LC7/MglB family)
MPPAADANIGFTLTPESRTAMMRLMDGFAGELPQASVILTDLAGRIVDVARKPLGVTLEGIAALAAGVFASTSALAKSMGDDEFSLVFEHDADRQVYVRPIAGRALLVVLLKGAAAAERIDDRLEGPLGADLAAVISRCRRSRRRGWTSRRFPMPWARRSGRWGSRCSIWRPGGARPCRPRSMAGCSAPARTWCRRWPARTGTGPRRSVGRPEPG